ncbi:MAG: helicase-associated domain-containing protein, partial [Planctomycetes bacterium]|nr:helicase-associated domain-containing protein [Planctomycetota bacterium]
MGDSAVSGKAVALNLTNPLIVQSDRSMLLEVDNPRYEEARDHLARFAELAKSPEHIHTYRISALSLWNAAAAGHGADEILEWLREFSKYPIPENVAIDVRDYIGKYGKLKLLKEGEQLLLDSTDPLLLEEVARSPSVARHLEGRDAAGRLRVAAGARGRVKQALIKIHYPVEDLAGYLEGARLAIGLRTEDGLQIRRYQEAAARAFWAGGRDEGGSGVVVLPCGAGKTIVGMAVMALVGTHTLVLTTGRTAVAQWRRELLEKTTLAADQIGEYTADLKELKPVTLTTYQILTYRKSAVEEFLHFGLFVRGDWGLVIYDEVHLLPAPVFRATADIQARRRLGLTATLVREDGREDDVFSLVGPKKYDMPWRELEAQGWIATAHCTEVRVALEPALKAQYALASARAKFRLASENPQ